MSRPFGGDPVLVAGAGVSGLAAATALVDAGARVLLSDDRADALAALPDGVEPWRGGGIPEGVRTVVTSPGRRPDHPLVAEATGLGVEVIGEPELAWRLGALRDTPPSWLVVTGTNGKTTTTEMLAAILARAGVDAVACGNIGHPVVTAVAEGHAVLAVELSSFQLHWSPSVRPAAGVVLNVAEDHLDWHGGTDAYAAAKARALLGDVAVGGVDDPVAARLLGESPAPRRVGVTLGPPGPDQLGVADGVLTDRAFGGGALLAADAVVPGAARDHRRARRGRAGPRARCGPGAHRRRPGGVHPRPAPQRPGRRARRCHLPRRLQGDQPARRRGRAGRRRRPAAGARAVWVVGGLLKGSTRPSSAGSPPRTPSGWRGSS
ncbi:Mur ligase family protein [Pseudonocardia alni]|uniref:Mur ligase family protein n=1 Tax=Pseudonocardia alni TaxID=33907 RepID=UPI00386DC773